MLDPTPRPATAAAQIRALETLLEVQEQIVLEQTARLEASLEHERKARRNLQALDRVAGAIAGRMELGEVVQLAVDAARELTDAAFSAFFYNVGTADDESYLLSALSGASPEVFERFPMPRNTALFEPIFRGDGVVRLDDVTTDPRYGRSSSYHGMPPDHLAVRSYLAVPVVSADGGVEGGIFLGHPDVGIFTPDAAELAVSIARHAAIAIVNARLYEASQSESESRRIAFEERDRVARVLQNSLLPPTLPDVPGIELAARYDAAGESVGGDFYDVFQIGSRTWGVILGDVCGRGPEAAAVTALTRHALRTAAMIEDNPATVIGILNEALLRDQSDRFVTAIFARLTALDGGYEMELCTAGHPPILLSRADGQVQMIEPETCLLGVYEEVDAVARTFKLGPGDTLVLYTDGLTETRRAGETFGESRLATALTEHRHRPCAVLADRLLAASQAFADTVSKDDTAVLVARINARPNGHTRPPESVHST